MSNSFLNYSVNNNTSVRKVNRSSGLDWGYGMTYVIQMRGREWPESMGWQNTDFVPDDRTPAEWVANMNEGDPQIEYRLVSDVVQHCSFDCREGHTIEVLLLRRIDEVQKNITVFRDASHLSGMDQALASAVEESVFLHKLLKRVEALTV